MSSSRVANGSFSHSQGKHGKFFCYLNWGRNWKITDTERREKYKKIHLSIKGSLSQVPKGKKISETGRQERVSIGLKIFPCGSTKKRWLVLQTVRLSLSSLKQHTAFVWELSFPLLLSCHPFVLCLLYFHGKVLLNIKRNKIISRFVICDIRNNQGLVISRSQHNQFTSTWSCRISHKPHPIIA